MIARELLLKFEKEAKEIEVHFTMNTLDNYSLILKHGEHRGLVCDIGIDKTHGWYYKVFADFAKAVFDHNPKSEFVCLAHSSAEVARHTAEFLHEQIKQSILKEAFEKLTSDTAIELHTGTQCHIFIPDVPFAYAHPYFTEAKKDIIYYLDREQLQQILGKEKPDDTDETDYMILDIWYITFAELQKIVEAVKMERAKVKKKLNKKKPLIVNP